FKEHSARNFVFPGSAAFSAAEKRDYEPCFAARQQLFNISVATAGLNFQASCTRQTAAHHQPCFPLPRRVSVSAKEA
ncbi:hypothetical protein LGN17_33810, partial [Burkholderia sp. AU30280]|uniref:hypothetical protein n=1 Tax=Burkholderia sp. AU30280 TaxID=2879628 RepID=UPI001CF13735